MITVLTPTIPGRESQLVECMESVSAAGLLHEIELDTQHEGPAVIRNRLLDQVTTPWVVFLDDDDLLYPHYAETVRPYLRQADVVYTAWDLSGAPDPEPFPFFDGELLMRQNFIPVTACVRVRALCDIGGFPDCANEDHMLWKRLFKRGYRFYYVPIVAWHYRRSFGSRTEVSKSEVK